MSRIHASPLLAVLLLSSACNTSVVAESYLQIISLEPNSGSSNVSVDTNVIATFSERLVEDSVNDATVYMFAGEDSEAYVLADVGYVESDESKGPWSIQISPTTPLAETTSYTVVLTTGVEGRTSGSLTSEVTTSFTTEGWSPNNELPVAIAPDDMTIELGDTATLDGGESYDPEGEALLYTWSIVSAPEGNVAELSNASSAVASLTPELPEGASLPLEYVVSLVVDDGTHASSADYLRIFVTDGGGGGDTGGGGDDTGAVDDTGL